MRTNILKTFFVLFTFCIVNMQTVFAIPASVEKNARETGVVSTSDIRDSEAEIIKRFSLKKKLQRSPENQIKSFYKNYVKYSEKNDAEKLKSLYSDSFVNNDGFNKSTIFEMMAQSADAYKDVVYNNNVEKIFTDGNYAVVDVHEFAMGTTTNKNEKINDYGLITSDMYYTDYLRKENNKWKIISTTIKSEKLLLKYGETKAMAVDITAPQMVPSGCEYDVKVSVDSPDGVLVIGSIVNDEIVYPHSQKKDVYRSVKSDVLERVVRANTNGRNEYVSATIGLTRASIEPPNVLFKMTGMALIMTRVNTAFDKSNGIKKEVLVDKK